MYQKLLTVASNENVAKDIFRITLTGDLGEELSPGQFVNLQLPDLFLRRPLSICDLSHDSVTLLYKVVGKGTQQLSRVPEGTVIDTLVGLGNGFDLGVAGGVPLLVGGGMGVAPLYYLAKKLLASGRHVYFIAGFNSKDDAYLINELNYLKSLGATTIIATMDGSLGVKGTVIDAMGEPLEEALSSHGHYTHFYTCGPEPMMRAVCEKAYCVGQASFEARMGCGFGACMGCTCETLTGGHKKICKDGPVMRSEEVFWK